MRRVVTATFRSLGNRNYRLYFTGQTISVMGTWMQKVAQAWLVLELTGSGTLLGLTAACQQLPVLLVGPWAGLLADRVNKRRIMVWTQSASVVPAAILGTLVAFDLVEFWMVLALALTLGTIEALDKPARHTIVNEIVDAEHVVNAITLNNITNNLGKVTGPAVGGVLIVSVGLAGAFFVNAVSYLAVVAGLLLMRADQLAPVTPARRKRGQLREGLRYVRGEPGLLGPLLLMTVTGMLAYEWTVTLPVLASDTFDGDAGTVGLLFSAMGVGAVIGGLAVTSVLKATVGRMMVTALVFAVCLLAVAVAPTLTVAVGVLFLLGAASIAFRAVVSSYLQLESDPVMRGRVISLLIVGIAGTTPIGGPLVGWLAEVFGARWALAVGGVTTVVAAVACLLYLKRWTARPRTGAAVTGPVMASGEPATP